MSSETNSGQLPNEIENVESMGSDKRMLGRKQLTAAETLSAEIQEKVKEAFQIFDHENNNTVDAREIGIFAFGSIRSIRCPTKILVGHKRLKLFYLFLSISSSFL